MIVKHLASVERWWFRSVFPAKGVPVGWTEADPYADWRTEPGDTTVAVLALYQGEVGCSRAVIAGAVWDDVASRPDCDQTLGWILTYVVEEAARHNGRADIVREQTDGATGEWVGARPVASRLRTVVARGNDLPVQGAEDPDRASGEAVIQVDPNRAWSRGLDRCGSKAPAVRESERSDHSWSQIRSME